MTGKSRGAPVQDLISFPFPPRSAVNRRKLSRDVHEWYLAIYAREDGENGRRTETRLP